MVSFSSLSRFRTRPSRSTAGPPQPKPDFQSLIALFYPSVTGIMAGCNRSGVLAQPSRSIPIGTLSAILCTTSFYLLVVWVFGSVLSHETLLDNPYVTADVAWPHPVVVKVGIIMSSLGAALQSLTGAPRLLSYRRRQLSTVLGALRAPQGRRT